MINNFVVKEISLVKLSTDDRNINLNIALAIDENYITPSGVLLFSILENNNENIHFHIFTTCNDLDKFSDFKKLNTDITIYVLNQNYFSSLQTPGRFTSAIYYRIAIPSILQNRVKNVLYIDADVLCIGSLEEFNKIDISDYYIAAVEDLGMIREDIVALGIADKYFNSGVMYINVEKWIQDNIFEKFMVLVNEKEYDYPDQDVLNILFINKVFYIPNKYNHFKEKDSKNSILIHYIGYIKPWTIIADENDLYLEYYSRSPFNYLPLQLPKTYKLAKQLAKKYLRSEKYVKAIKWYLMYVIMKIKHKMK